MITTNFDCETIVADRSYPDRTRITIKAAATNSLDASHLHMSIEQAQALVEQLQNEIAGAIRTRDGIGKNAVDSLADLMAE